MRSNSFGDISAREFWDTFYDRIVLERFDLSKLWKVIASNPQLSLSETIGLCFNKFSPIEIYSITGTLESITSDSSFVKSEIALMVANTLKMVEEIPHGGLESTMSALITFLKDPTRPAGSLKLPEKFIVELTNSCNLNCVMCGVGRNGYDQSKTMDLDFFKALCSNAMGSAKTVRLNGLGESTIIPEFLRYLDIAAGQLRAEFEIVTNLTTPREEVLRKLVEMDFRLFISCDAVDRQDLAKIRRGIDPDRFLHNVKALSELSSRANRDPLRTHIIMTLLSSNFRQLPDMVRFASDNRIGGVIANMQKGSSTKWMHKFLPDLIDTFSRAHKYAQELGIQLFVPNLIEGNDLPVDFAVSTNSSWCPTYKQEVFVRYNGDICPCNMMNPYVYGNLREKSLKEILGASPRLLFERMMQTDDRHPYCKNCYFLRKEDL